MIAASMIDGIERDCALRGERATRFWSAATGSLRLADRPREPRAMSKRLRIAVGTDGG